MSDRPATPAAYDSAVDKVFAQFPGLGGSPGFVRKEGEAATAAWSRMVRSLQSASDVLKNAAFAIVDRGYPPPPDARLFLASDAVLDDLANLHMKPPEPTSRWHRLPPTGFFTPDELAAGNVQNFYLVAAHYGRTHEVLLNTLLAAAEIDPNVRHDLAAVLERVPTLTETPWGAKVQALGGEASKSSIDFNRSPGSTLTL